MKKKIKWENAGFVKSATAKDGYPVLKDDRGKPLPEIAIAGRSNVGKSTLVNDLFLSKKLAKASSTPGKTQLLNFFSVDKQIAFVDLPGYGFARVPIEVRREWGPMIQGYLSNRESLKAILFLFDIRRSPDEEDLLLMEWIERAGLDVILVLTKVDKINKSALKSATEDIIRGFQRDAIHTVHYSVPEKLGRTSLIKTIESLFEE